MTAEETTRHFRNVTGAFATGITLVTAARDGVYSGLTVNSFSSVSLDPTLVLVCVDLTSESHPAIRESGAFAINILRHDHEQISRAFATKDPNKHGAIEGLDVRPGVTGSPILQNALAYIEARVVQEIHAGDHTIFIGEVQDCASFEGEPILFFRGKYRSLAPLDA
jgi:3-hydroxy-9,10-secoandrosta-1,3,5(10)-triene-9,17-dione monooxygenase reductase component